METAEPDDFINQEELDKVFDIVIEMTLTPLPGLRASLIESQLQKLANTLSSYVITGAAVMLGVGALTAATHSGPLASTVMAMSIVLQFVGIGIGCLTIMSGVVFLRAMKRSPYAPFLKHVANAFTFDLRFLNRLSLCNLDALRYVLSYYKFERIGAERRFGLIGGAIGRIGFFPAIAALAMLWVGLAQLQVADYLAPALVLPTIGFYGLHFVASEMLHKKDRVIAMLEFVVRSHGTPN